MRKTEKVIGFFECSKNQRGALTASVPTESVGTRNKSDCFLLSMRILLVALLVSSASLFTSCASSAWQVNEERIVVGRIFVTGNEPFTKLAIELGNHQVYILHCDGPTAKLLVASQGRIMRVRAKGAVRVPEGNAVDVLEASLVPSD
jgi:hypothetical protein